MRPETDSLEGLPHLAAVQLKPFREINRSMPLSYIDAFLLVAMEEGKGVAEYASAAQISPTVMTRNLLDIGDRNRRRESGYGLVTQERDLFDLRKHNGRVTSVGKPQRNPRLNLTSQGYCRCVCAYSLLIHTSHRTGDDACR
jgi:hypothetical protein